MIVLTEKSSGKKLYVKAADLLLQDNDGGGTTINIAGQIRTVSESKELIFAALGVQPIELAPMAAPSASPAKK